MNGEYGGNVEVTKTSIKIKNSLIRDDLMNLESEDSFKTTRTVMRIESDNYEKYFIC